MITEGSLARNRTLSRLEHVRVLAATVHPPSRSLSVKGETKQGEEDAIESAWKHRKCANDYRYQQKALLADLSIFTKNKFVFPMLLIKFYAPRGAFFFFFFFFFLGGGGLILSIFTQKEVCFVLRLQSVLLLECPCFPGLSFDSTFLSPLLFFLPNPLVLSVLSLSPNGPFSWLFLSRKPSNIFR